ncbi:hypothetical protein ACVWYN_000804 [Pedobacter sp. UYP24]
MFIKSPSILHVFARQKEEIEYKAISRKQWIMADRIVVTALFLIAIVSAILFS